MMEITDSADLLPKYSDIICDSIGIQFSQFFQLLSDDTRLRSIFLIQQEGELCVCELMHALGLSQPKISRHMAALREAGLVTATRRAQWVFYDIKPTLSDWQKQVLAAALTSLSNDPVIAQDETRLKTMNDRPQKYAA